MLHALSGPLCTLTLGMVSASSSLPDEMRPDPTAVPVRLEAPDGVAIGWHLLPQDSRTGEPPPTPRFAPLCKAPCTTELPFGDHELAILRGEEPPLVAFPSVRLQGPATLQLEVNSRESQRRFGFWLTVISATLGVASTTVGLIPKCDYDETCSKNASLALWGGIGILSFGGLFGVPLMMRQDEVVLKVRPQN